MPNNTANRKSIAAATRSARERDRERGQVLVSLMSTIQGREFLWSKLETANVFSTTYSDSALRMAFAEGLRAAGLSLLNDVIQWCPDLFIQAMREANQRKTEAHEKDKSPDLDEERLETIQETEGIFDDT